MATATGPVHPRPIPLDPQPMVDWFSPGELARAGLKAALATTFGAYADKREVQAALHPGNADWDADYSNEGELWLDYVADLGDGFNATYALAWLLSRPRLEVAGPGGEGGTQPLPRGRVLVMGGDQVYPTATREEYQKRFTGPYEAAFGSVEGAEDLFALPGNHDWYDGLTAFTRLFCQQRWIGGLRTRQKRSYFALRLPRNWWLWGIDVQLNADVDLPQLVYFDQIAEKMKAAAAPETPRLILCTAEPSWVHCGSGHPEPAAMKPDRRKFATLAYFERRAVREHGLRLALTLSGDLHHYVHYAPGAASSPRRITSGGGGAYLYPTHHMPRTLALPEPDGKGGSEVGYELKQVFPSAGRSQSLGWRVLLLPFRNSSFATFLGGLYLLFAWMVQSASKSANGVFRHMQDLQPPPGPNTSLLELLTTLGADRFWDVSRAFWHVMRHSPASVAFALLVVFGLYKYREADDATWGKLWGAVHGLAHMALSCVLIWAFAWINLGLLGRWFPCAPGASSLWPPCFGEVDSFWQALLFSLEMLTAGGIAGGCLFAAYLLLSSRTSGAHINDVYSSQSIPDYKNFARLHLGRDGRLRLYPIAVPSVPGDDGWQPAAAGATTPPQPAAGSIRSELIEEPIAIE